MFDRPWSWGDSPYGSLLAGDLPPCIYRARRPQIQEIRKKLEHRKIFELLKEKIIWLELMPETTINLSELAESFEVSRTPIKEALILLQAQG